MNSARICGAVLGLVACGGDRDTEIAASDEAAIRELLSTVLTDEGYEVATADSGAAGLAAATSQPPSAIVLDVRMFDLDGFEVNRRLKALPSTAEIPVVFLSASIQDAARQRALAEGAAAYLTKPYDAGEVLEVMKRAIAGRADQGA